MTYEQNVEAILESNFAGFKEEIIDNACERICMLGTKEETIDSEVIRLDLIFEDAKKEAYKVGQRDTIKKVLEMLPLLSRSFTSPPLYCSGWNDALEEVEVAVKAMEDKTE